MNAARRRRSRGGSRGRARLGWRLGVGTGDAIAKLVAAAVCSGVLVVAVERRWSVLLLIPLGLVWAAVFAGFIVVPLVAGFIADSLSQHGGRRPLSPPDRGYDTASWSREYPAPAYPPPRPAGAIPVTAPTGGRTVAPLVAGLASGFDWPALVEGVASRLEAALGEGFSAAGEGTSLVLSYGDVVRKVDLGQAFLPPPAELGQRALTGCLKMMDEAQAFAMRVRQEPWPSRGSGLDGAPGSLARPRVRLDDGEIHLLWTDGWGTVLRLPPLPFERTSAPFLHGTW